MARERLTFRERDLSAALKVMQERGIAVTRVEVRKDGVAIFVDRGGGVEEIDTAVADASFEARIARIRNADPKDL
jgi:hypothetical protein